LLLLLDIQKLVLEMDSLEHVYNQVLSKYRFKFWVLRPKIVNQVKLKMFINVFLYQIVNINAA